MKTRPALIATIPLVVGAFLALGKSRHSESAVADKNIELGAMDSVLERHGLAAALDSLVARTSGDPALERSGHQLAHALGRKAVAHRGAASAIADCRAVFASGCYHGVVEASLNADSVDMIGFHQFCLSAGDGKHPAPTFECFHGLGHGLLGARRYDVNAALRDCDALSAPRMVASCHSGVFMEAINTAIGAQMTSQHHGHETDRHPDPGTPDLLIDTDDAYSPCRSYRDPYAESCWLFQGFLILRANSFDVGRALKLCGQAPSGREPRCYQSVGHQLTGLFQEDDRWILAQCSKGDPARAPHCAAGATLALSAMDWTGFRAARLCAAAPQAWKSICYGSASRALVDLASLAEREQFCARVEPAYAVECRLEGGLGTS